MTCTHNTLNIASPKRGSRAISAPCAACPVLRPQRCIKLLHQTADARNRTWRAQVLRHARCTTSKMRVKPRHVTARLFLKCLRLCASPRAISDVQCERETECLTNRVVQYLYHEHIWAFEYRLLVHAGRSTRTAPGRNISCACISAHILLSIDFALKLLNTLSNVQTKTSSKRCYTG